MPVEDDVPVVLGIDAAWTTTQPSGVCVVVGEPGRWRLAAIAKSYADFYRQAGFDPADPGFNATLLLDSARRVGGAQLCLIAADIPLAKSPIVGRRVSDNAVSRLYGARHAGTHSPSALTPGALADSMRAEFGLAGYPLQTKAPATGGLIEVYPHPALIELTGAARRLPYKIGKIASYWPGQSRIDRRHKLLAQWLAIVALLDERIEGVAHHLPAPDVEAPARVLKGYEDALDAVVCAWVGVCVLEGKAVALGDDESAIWVPLSGAAGQRVS